MIRDGWQVQIFLKTVNLLNRLTSIIKKDYLRISIHSNPITYMSIYMKSITMDAEASIKRGWKAKPLKQSLNCLSETL